MVQTTYRRFDAAEFLETEDDIAGFIQDSAESGDPAVMLNALAAVARARSMQALADTTEMSRSGLYKALSAQGNPSFALVDKIAKAMGFRVTLVPLTLPTRSTRKSTTAMKRVAKRGKTIRRAAAANA